MLEIVKSGGWMMLPIVICSVIAAAIILEAYGQGAFMARVHPDADVRIAATEEEEKLNLWGVEVVFRPDLYAAVKRLADSEPEATHEQKRLLDFWLRDFRRAGHELEPTARGPYAGAVGYIDFAGNMDTAIGLRTMIAKGETAWIQAGAGVVADSDPTFEYHESVAKAGAVLAAIDAAQTLDGVE